MHFEPKLIDFHYGTLDESDRLDMENKLLESPALLAEYFEVKRSFEDFDDQYLVPSPELKQKIQHSLFYGKKQVLIRFMAHKRKSIAAAAVAIFFVTSFMFPAVNNDSISQSPENEVNVDSSSTLTGYRFI
jgi:hypothetical protein